MFLPLGDEPNPPGIPWMTYGLMAVNILVYALVSLPLSVMRPDPGDPALAAYVQVLVDQLPPGYAFADLLQRVSAYDLFIYTHGFRPAEPEITALFTSMFLHAGFLHLAGNMLFLWIYGDNVEHRLGPGPYLAAYLMTGVAATVFHAAFELDSALPVVGASGAISGVLGFYFLWFPRNRVRLWVALFPLFMHVVTLPARFVLGIYLFIDNVMPFLIAQSTAGGGVAYGAHIGGFLGGLGWAWWSGRHAVASVPHAYRGAEPTPMPSAADPDAINALVAAGRFADAAPIYFRVPAERSRKLLSPGHAVALADWLARNGHAEAALVVYQRHLRDYPLGPLRAEAHLGAGRVQLHALGQPAAAYQHLVDVFDCDPDPEIEVRARQALAQISSLRRA